MDNKMTRGEWLYKATREIRFKLDREEVEEELRAHLEDKLEDIHRIFPDIPAEEAEQRILADMGDPEEVGKALARIHRPWWGYLWRASRVLLAVLLVVNLFFWGRAGVNRFQTWWEYERELNQSQYIEDCYYHGIDPFSPDSPWYEAGHVSDVIRTPLLITHPGDRATAGGYRFSVDQAALWSIHKEDEPDSWWLFCTLQAEGPPWQPFALNAAWYIRATDSFGNRYYSSYEVYDLDMDQGEAGYVRVNPGDSGFARETFELEVIDIAPGAEWLRLEYDRDGTGLSLTIPLKEDEA